MKENKRAGIFVISLDFELMWGMIDHADAMAYGRSNVAQVPQVIDRLLETFGRYGIHATIAPVGLMLHKDAKTAAANVPSVVPTYTDGALSPYSNNYIDNIKPECQPLFFAPELVEKLKSHPNIEIGTHTYCHYYCYAEGQTVEQFAADLDMVVKVSAEHGIVPRSIIFPRNNVDAAYLATCREHGITIYRGNAKKYYGPVSGRWANLKQRLCRLLDGYINLGVHSTFVLSELETVDGMVNVPASRFLRPYSRRLRWLESLKVRRIKSEMTHAAKQGELYHLWWHPHNFGANTDENFAVLEQILQHFVECNEKHGMKSLTMAEAALHAE